MWESRSASFFRCSSHPVNRSGKGGVVSWKLRLRANPGMVGRICGDQASGGSGLADVREVEVDAPESDAERFLVAHRGEIPSEELTN